MTNTMNAAKACIAIALAITLTACATNMGREFDTAYAQQIKPGETTKAQIREKLGRPPLVRKAGDDDVWTYAYYLGRSPALYVMDTLGFTDADMQGQGKQKRLVITFKGDVVKDSKFVEELPVVHSY